jgi:hypothetical protein
LLLLTASLTIADNGPTPAPYSKDDPARTVVEEPRFVGEIKIIGNTRTRQSIILDHLTIYPGQTFTTDDLRVAEEALAQLRIFKANPRVTVADPKAEYCAILVRVEDREPTHPWEKEVDDMVDDCIQYLAIGALIAFGPERLPSPVVSIVEALGNWRVYKAHSHCEPLWDAVEIIAYQTITVSSNGMRAVQQYLIQGVRSCLTEAGVR